ncbi:MAG TPA: hypothetical protein VG733_06930, partial [Chthoniobacteraceae bacterium]|nr:hypothetical protein [Chthoniobacteraceae bacterium]
MLSSVILAQIARAANDTWTTGTGDGTGNWNAAGNWIPTSAHTPPASGDTLVFSTTTGTLSLIDNLMTPGTFNVAGISFLSGASSYVINSSTVGVNGFTLTGGITNSSTSLQTINDLIAISGTQTITTASAGGNIIIGGSISGGGLTVAGSGTLTL